MKSVIVHYHELALKGRNRPWFVDRLKRNLRVATADLDVERVRTLMGRIELVLGPEGRWEDVQARLETVCGVANFSRAGRASSDLDALGAAILADLGIPVVRLLTNNPMKVNAMREFGIDVASVERLNISALHDNRTYLRTKRDRLGHDLLIDTTDKGASA